MRTQRIVSSVVVVCAALLVSACGSKPAPAGVTVTGIEVGRSLSVDKRVAEPTDTFGPADTMYASVATAGSGTATLRAVWTYEGGQMVNESSQTITPTGPAQTEFHVSNPGGWPTGRYRLEVSLNGTPAGSKQVEVK